MRVVRVSIVRVPLGPRQVAGNPFWDGGGRETSTRKSCARIEQVFDCPPIDRRCAAFVDWVRNTRCRAGHGGAHACSVPPEAFRS